MANRKVWFFFIGLAASLTVLTLIVWPVKLSFEPAQPTAGAAELLAVLPAGAALGDSAVVDVTPSGGDLTLVVGFTADPSGGLALLTRAMGADYRVLSVLFLSESVPELAAGQPSLTANGLPEFRLGAIQIAIDVGGVTHLMYAETVGDRLAFVTAVDGGGQRGPVIFRSGDRGLETFRFEILDVDGDGRAEAVQREWAYGGGSFGAGRSFSASAFRWQDGEFVFDKELSRALTMSGELFPEPATP